MAGRFHYLLASVALLLLACAPAAPTPAPTAPQPTAPTPAARAPEPATAAVQRGGTFVHAASGTLAHCYTLEAQDRFANVSLDHVYEKLVSFDFLKTKDYRADLEAKPRLAERWEQPEPTTYIFHLRQGVKWHDGEPFTADDVVATAQTTLKANFRSAATWRVFKSIEKVDANTVRLTTGGPAPMALASLANPSDGHILPKKYLDAGTMQQNCVGTGPFKVAAWDKTRTEQAANPDFYLKDDSGGKLPYLDAIRIIYGMNRAAQEAALAAGEVDLYNFGSFEEFDAFQKRVPDLKTEPFWTHHTFSMFINLNRKPLDDLNVRKALNLLVDRHKVSDLLHSGKGKIGLPVVPAVKEGWGLSQEELRRLPGFRKDKTEDVAEAKRLLAAAGLADGLSFDLLHAQIGSGLAFAQAMPGILKPYGIDVKVRGLDSASVAKERAAGSFDALMWPTANFDPILRTDEFFYTKGQMGKVASLPDRGQDALIDQLRIELSPAKQKELVRRLQEIVLENHWAIPLGDPAGYAVTRGWVHNYRPSYGEPADVTGTSEFIWIDQSLLPAKRKS